MPIYMYDSQTFSQVHTKLLRGIRRIIFYIFILRFSKPLHVILTCIKFSYIQYESCHSKIYNISVLIYVTLSRLQLTFLKREIKSWR